MSLKTKEIVQTALSQNERVLRRQVAAFGVLFLALLAILGWIGHLAGETNRDARELMVWAVFATVVTITYGVMGLAIYISRTTARLLRTIAVLREEA